MARDGLYVRDMDGGYNSLRRLGNDGRLQIGQAARSRDRSTRCRQARGMTGRWMLGTSWLLPFTVFRHEPAAEQHGGGATRTTAVAGSVGIRGDPHICDGA